MTSKHTPGPWALETVATSVGSCHKIGPFPSSGTRKEVHACVYADGIRLGLDEQTRVAIELAANARLIAAAPELLEALQTMVEECKYTVMEASALDRAVEAIAKATGEQA